MLTIEKSIELFNEAKEPAAGRRRFTCSRI